MKKFLVAAFEVLAVLCVLAGVVLLLSLFSENSTPFDLVGAISCFASSLVMLWMAYSMEAISIYIEKNRPVGKDFVRDVDAIEKIYTSEGFHECCVKVFKGSKTKREFAESIAQIIEDYQRHGVLDIEQDVDKLWDDYSLL